MASPSPDVRSWRTSFLTLRDETLNPPPPSSLLTLLQNVILSHPSASLIAAAAQLPSHEITSDLVLLAGLASATLECPDAAAASLQICHLIHDVTCSIRLEINSSSWTIILNFFEKLTKQLLCEADAVNFAKVRTARVDVISEILEIIRHIYRGYGPKSSLSDNTELVGIVLCLISCLHTELLTIHQSNFSLSPATDIRVVYSTSKSLWEMQTIAYVLTGEALSKLGSSISANLWHCVLEGLRKAMDFLASKNLIIEDYVMSRFYATLLHCLHMILLDPKGSLSGHVAGFVSTLQMFFTYGLSSRSFLVPTTIGSVNKENGTSNHKSRFVESSKNEHGRYKPPHLRKKETLMQVPKSLSSSDSELSKNGFTSSDSDQSDGDGFAKFEDPFRSSKARIAAINCVQAICHADPKSLTSLWTILLPETDVLQPRRYPATLMTCLLFDPISKIRIAAASTLAAMLDRHALFFLQVAEYKGSIKCGSFTTLSSSLGHILMQLHRGILYLIQHQPHSGLSTPLFKVLSFLISATPYARMPEELLPSVIVSLRAWMMEDLANKHIGLLGIALSCLEAALSRSPSSVNVLKVLEEDISKDCAHRQQGSSLPHILLQLTERGRHSSVKLEALQVLKALIHNYPSLVTRVWECISSVVYSLLQTRSTDEFSPEICSASWRGESGKSPGSNIEKCTMAGVKVLDECLRAASGFKGTELTDGLEECGSLDIQILSDFRRRIRVSSAPSYDLNGLEAFKCSMEGHLSGSNLWSEVIMKHLPLALSHSSSMVRAASLTCFAGLTLPVFSSFTKENQEFVISLSISAARNDQVSLVRSAACRAIGVIAFFPQVVSCSSVLNEFIRAAEFNSHDPTTSVRITASWALANICDSLRQKATTSHSECSSTLKLDPESISVLVESALRLTKDGDKIKSNAVRALGNLSRFIQFSDHSSPKNLTSNCINLCDSDSDWLERMVQAFVSCVTTGNVKVQWNVCHALGNLFMNDTMKLKNMSWTSAVYSILLLLLRDSTNFKIRIHAAVALSVPGSRLDYGNSFADVVQSLVHVLETLNSDQTSTPSGFKYKGSLEKQVTLTSLHVLGFASSEDDQALKDFLIKKASFLEDWFKLLSASLMEVANQPSSSKETSSVDQEDIYIPHALKKTKLLAAAKSLSNIYTSSKRQGLAQRFVKYVDNLAEDS
ncbi:HEAT repeat-containing protein 6 isoform X1 [Dioscorea cayenensis subsp. rotundata]|uniref:HEAT repeat-containing protein 6 isoform X1 n=2 Tax=Dioscorea cayennensis subsp. rotundata TaxID=55577 RepID=A0AB40B9E4_DIOCR|nr:HEAT repeat-containing protein 6 isoform X1 [Dioscorea cayenensis subsp. rotundata]